MIKPPLQRKIMIFFAALAASVGVEVLEVHPAHAQEATQKKWNVDLSARFMVMNHRFEDQVVVDETITSDLDFTKSYAFGPEFQLTVAIPSGGPFFQVTGAYGRKYAGQFTDVDILTAPAAALFAEQLGVPLSDVTDVIPIDAVISNTISALDDANTFHFSGQVGWTFPFFNDRLRLTPTVGYFFLRDVYRAVGLIILPDDVDGLFTGPPFELVFDVDTLVLEERVTWRGFRLGVDLEADISKRWLLDISAAGIPAIGRLRNVADLLLRPEDGVPTFITDSDNAFSAQVEGAVGFRFTQKLSAHVGGRYWRFGGRNATQIAGPSLPEEEQTVTGAANRLRTLGGYVELRYRF